MGTKREKITIESTMSDIMYKMSEGNPGALSVLVQLLERDPLTGFMNILTLDDMNIRGAQVWVGYKDHCGQDIDVFTKALEARDPALVDAINACHPLDMGTDEKAVTSGASFNR